jgi:thymidylate synthase
VERVKLLGYKNEIVDKTIDRYGEDVHIENCDKHNIPTRVISLMYNQRSVDTLLGLPFNIASYGLLLKMIAKEVNMIPDELIGNLGDVHLYRNHIQQAKEQLTREPMDLPKVLINNGDVDNNGVPFTKSILDGYDITDFELVNYKSHPKIKAPLSN